MNAEYSPQLLPVKDKVVVAIPVYNETKHVAETIACLKQQTLSTFKVLIADNASTDTSREFLLLTQNNRLSIIIYLKLS